MPSATLTRVVVSLTLASALLLRGARAEPLIAQSQAQSPRTSTFAELIAKLSEPGGDFGGDNLISNEQSYLRVLPALARGGVTGGAYLGVGPDQNLSYIAQVKPAIAFIIDIRRDNLLLHLLFKAIFSVSPTRIEYLCALTGRAPPVKTDTWTDASIDKLSDYIDAAHVLGQAEQRTLSGRLDAAMKAAGSGFTLWAADLQRIHEFHDTFIQSGLALVFAARGRPPSFYYPSLRTLLTETDGAGHRASFLAVESSYQFVRNLEARDLIIPVVGDVSGPHAMAAIATEMTARGTPLSAFYVSNVEQYLYQDGRFPAFVANLRRLPRTDRSTVIRSIFPSGYRGALPQSTSDSYSTSLTQGLDVMLKDVAAGRYRTYADLVVASSTSAIR
jgi:hypothetical protein